MFRTFVLSVAAAVGLSACTPPEVIDRANLTFDFEGESYPMTCTLLFGVATLSIDPTEQFEELFAFCIVETPWGEVGCPIVRSGQLGLPRGTYDPANRALWSSNARNESRAGCTSKIKRARANSQRDTSNGGDSYTPPT